MAKKALYFRVPYQWVKGESKSLSHIAFRLYFALLSFANHTTRECVVKQDTLAKIVGITRPRISQFLVELADAGLITYKPEKPDHKEGKPIIYVVHDPMQIHLHNLGL
jgi:predicted transcriptional regulator